MVWESDAELKYQLEWVPGLNGLVERRHAHIELVNE